jgi:hypothetical protein
VKVSNPTEQKLRMKSKAIVEGPVQFVQVLYLLAVLTLTVDFCNSLIVAEGTETPAGGRGRGDPAGA